MAQEGAKISHSSSRLNVPTSSVTLRPFLIDPLEANLGNQLGFSQIHNSLNNNKEQRDVVECLPVDVCLQQSQFGNAFLLTQNDFNEFILKLGTTADMFVTMCPGARKHIFWLGVQVGIGLFD